jgi:hypothetical protein
MSRTIQFFLIPILFFTFLSSATGAICVGQGGSPASEKILSRKEIRQVRKEARKARRMEKLMEKAKGKVQKKIKKEAGGDLIDDERVRLGLILVVAGAIASIILVNPLAWLGGLAFLVGLVLILLALLDY